MDKILLEISILKKKITELENELDKKKDLEQGFKIQYAIATILAESPNVFVAIPEIIELLRTFLSCDIGELWVMDESLNILSCISISSNATSKIWTDYRLKRQRMVFCPNNGLIGQVFREQNVTINNDIDESTKNQFPDIKAIKIKSFIGIPISIENKKLGVFIFTSQNPIVLNESFFTILKSVGLQIGKYICHKRLEKDILYLAYHDPLTGIANRSSFEHEINSHINFNKTVAVVIFKINHFKHIIKKHGKSIADRLLQSIARRLKTYIRIKDTLARFSEDTFVLLMTDVTHPYAPGIFAQKIIDVLTMTFSLEKYEFNISTNVGISLFPNDGKSMEELLEKAEFAMQNSKARGLNTYQFFMDDITELAKQRIILQNDLKLAIQNQEFQMCYQPRIDLKTGEILGIESLIRWNRPNVGIVLPQEFIHLAEECELILPISEWVLKNVCQKIKDWLNNHIPIKKVAINISHRQFKQHYFIEKIKNILRETKIDSKYLEFEIPEPILNADIRHSIDTLRALKEINIDIAIDNFGTGYSSFTNIRHFNVDRLKIERTFISDIAHNKHSAAFVKSVITMAHHLKIKVVATGVENKEQLLELEKLKCDEIQGFYFNHPLTAIEIEMLLKKSSKLILHKPTTHLSIVKKNPKID